MQPRDMQAADLPRAAALSARAGWNQTGEDWRVFLECGAVRVLDDGDPDALAATAAVLPFGPALAWISMVLVRQDRRREGLATAFMRWALDRLAATPCVALDATPEGRAVYLRLGFRGLWSFGRWRLSAPLPAEPGIAVRPLGEGDWPALLALDDTAFGASRAALLRGFAGRLPAAGWIAEGSSGPIGFALGRDGVRAPQLGPVVARDAATARALVAAAHAALAGPVLLDLRDGAGLEGWLLAAGAERLRDFTRMVRGEDPPGATGHAFAVAGPEFG